MMHGVLNDERRAAIEIIVEEKTGFRDPEDRDGNLPDLEHVRVEAPRPTDTPYDVAYRDFGRQYPDARYGGSSYHWIGLFCRRASRWQ
jgi:hypothetical protein